MTCLESSRIDVGEFLLEPGASSFEDFRTHYPDCPDCTAAVHRWTLLEEALLDLGEDAHPTPERLAKFALEPGTLERAERTALTSHVASCESCRTEADALRGFDFDQVRGAAASTTAAEVASGGWWRWLLRPAPLAAAAAALVAALLYGGVGPEVGAPDRQIAQQSAPSEAAPPEDPLAPRLPDERRPDSQLAGHDGTPEASPDPHTGSARPAVEVAEERAPAAPEPELTPRAPAAPPRPREIARESTPAPAPSDALELRPDPTESAASPIVIAALVDLGPPSFATPPGVESWDRYLTTRGGRTDLPRVHVVAPAHVAHTESSSPSLYWMLESPSSFPIQIVLSDDRETLLELTDAPPVSAGLHRVDLAAHGLQLELGTTYRFSAMVVADPDAPSRNPVAMGALRRVPESELPSSAPSERGHVLAAAGLWYDAFDFFSRAVEAHPDEPALRAQRRDLLEAAELPAPSR